MLVAALLLWEHVLSWRSQLCILWGSFCMTRWLPWAWVHTCHVLCSWDSGASGKSDVGPWFSLIFFSIFPSFLSFCPTIWRSSNSSFYYICSFNKYVLSPHSRCWRYSSKTKLLLVSISGFLFISSHTVQSSEKEVSSHFSEYEVFWGSQFYQYSMRIKNVFFGSK